MVRRKFDSITRMLFADIQRQITVLDGQLLNRKAKNPDALRSAKSSLQAKARELKSNYYAKASELALEESNALIKRIQAFDVNSIRKI
jgi:hypothetical protein